MAEGERVRAELGFAGGQVISGFFEVGTLDQLERALHEDGPRVVVLDSEDGPYHVVVPQVSYFKRSSRSSRVGFGSA